MCFVVLLDKLTAVGAPSDAHAVGFRCVFLPFASVGDAPQAFGKCHGRVCFVVCVGVLRGMSGSVPGYLLYPLRLLYLRSQKVTGSSSRSQSNHHEYSLSRLVSGFSAGIA